MGSDAPMTKKRKTKSEKHPWLIDSLEHVLFPHQESEEEQESFTPEGRQRVDDWLSDYRPNVMARLQETRWLCDLCAGTMTSTYDDYPQQHDSDALQIMKTICYVGNTILAAIERMAAGDEERVDD